MIGEITRLNRDITAPKIKEYLNLNVSTYTILRACKLFEWNKLNPNSNQAKKAAALKRQLNGEIVRRKTSTRKSKCLEAEKSSPNTTEYSEELSSKITAANIFKVRQCESNDEKELDIDPNLSLLTEYDILNIKSASSSAMVFATRILYKVFQINELLGHNISGKTFNKFIKNKKALDQKRIYYIKWLVDTYYESSNKEELWKSCRTAINKSIRNHEIKGGLKSIEMISKENKPFFSDNAGEISSNVYYLTYYRIAMEINLLFLEPHELFSYNTIDFNSNLINEPLCNSTSQMPKNITNNNIHRSNQQTTNLLNLEPNMSIFQMSNEITNLEIVFNKEPSNPINKCDEMTSIVTLTDPSDLFGQLTNQDENKNYTNCFKKGV